MSSAWKGADNSRKRKARALPTGSGYCVPLPCDLLASPAWAALSRQGVRLLTALMIEHAEHGGEENGSLKAPYDTLKGVLRRETIKDVIHEAKALGLIDVDFGKRAHGSRRLPSTYRLTWLGTPDGLMATNEWKAIKTEEDARQKIATAKAKLEHERAVKRATRADRAARGNNSQARAA